MGSEKGKRACREGEKIMEMTIGEGSTAEPVIVDLPNGWKEVQGLQTFRYKGYDLDTSHNQYDADKVRILEGLNIFRNRTILDIGSNAGLFTFCLY